MSHLVSNWAKNAQSLPRNYVFPPGDRPGDVKVPICSDIPVIDLSQENGQSKGDLLQQIMKACQDYGLFQVINHGVSDKVMDDTMSVCHEFFEMPAEDKAKVYSEDLTKGCRLFTSGLNYSEERPNYWKDTLRHSSYPVEDHIQSWPEMPTRYRAVVGTYTEEVRKLTLKMLDLICEGLGLEVGYFSDDLSGNQVMQINHYPPCPNPDLALGLRGHCDGVLLTLLQQRDYGLQVLKDGEWMGVEPLPHGFVILVCNQLEIISNGKMKSAYHRAVTNSEVARTSIVTFTGPQNHCMIEPAKVLVNDTNPPLFRAFEFSEFLDAHMGRNPNVDHTKVMEFFKLKT